MNSHKRLATIFLALAGVLLLVLLIISRADQCVHDDKAVCSMLQSLKRIQKQPVYGTFTEENVISSKTTEWVLNPQQKEIQTSREEKELLHTIFTKDTVYVKNMGNNTWFSQNRESINEFSNSLLFDPERYLSDIYKSLSQQEKLYKKGISTVCDGTVCVRYQLSKEPDVEYIEIDRKTSKLRTYSVLDQNVRKTFFIHYGKKKITIPGEVQKAANGQNIFLESARNIQDEPKGRDLEYVKQFELQRQEVENVSSDEAR